MTISAKPQLSFKEAVDHIVRALLSMPGIGLASISGPSCSGKTTLAKALEEELRLLGNEPVMLCLDDYFRSKEDPEIPKDGTDPLFDLVSSFHGEEFVSAASSLVRGKTAMISRYDVENNRRLPRIATAPQDAVIAEGLFANSLLRRARVSAIYIYMDTPTAVCLARRIERDTAKWNVNRKRIVETWRRKTLPYLNLQRGPEKECADVIVTHS